LRQHERPHAEIALGPEVEWQEQNACRDHACGGKKETYVNVTQALLCGCEG